MPNTKDNLFRDRTLWLDRDGMEIARERFWKAYNSANPTGITGIGNLGDRQTWDVAWAAAVAAFSFLMEGHLGPSTPVDDSATER